MTRKDAYRLGFRQGRGPMSGFDSRRLHYARGLRSAPVLARLAPFLVQHNRDPPLPPFSDGPRDLRVSPFAPFVKRSQPSRVVRISSTLTAISAGTATAWAAGKHGTL